MKIYSLLSEAIRPPEKLSPVEWAERNIIVNKGPLRGNPWSCENGYEFQRDILNVTFGEHEPGENIREVVFRKGARAGMTLCSTIGLLYNVCHRGVSCALVSPRKPDAAERAQGLQEMILKNPGLKVHFRDSRGRIKKTKEGAELISTSAETERDLVDWDAAFVAADEKDRFHQGDFSQDAMIHERLGGYIERCYIQISTPTLPDFGIDAAWQVSDQRFFYVPCPHCEEFQDLQFEKNISWDKDLKSEDDQISSATFVCAFCERPWNRRQRQLANAQGYWRAMQPGYKRIGFGISRLYFPTSLPQEFVQSWLRSKKDEQEKREFYNQKLGKPFLSSVGNLKFGNIQRLIDDSLTWGKPPEGYNQLFAGLDVQGTEQFFYEVRAYNDDNSCALICYGSAYGIGELSKVLNATYGGKFIKRALIDISDGDHKEIVENAVREISCLEAARFDHKAFVNFKRFKKEKAGHSGAGVGGWAVHREDALNDNLSRFFEQQGKKPSIKIARNPNAGREKEFSLHYKNLNRIKEETIRGPVYRYIKLKNDGVDYPFAGALAEVARRISGSGVDLSSFGATSKLAKKKNNKTFKKPKGPVKGRASIGIIRARGARGRRR